MFTMLGCLPRRLELITKGRSGHRWGNWSSEKSNNIVSYFKELSGIPRHLGLRSLLRHCLDFGYYEYSFLSSSLFFSIPAHQPHLKSTVPGRFLAQRLWALASHPFYRSPLLGMTVRCELVFLLQVPSKCCFISAYGRKRDVACFRI